MTDESLLALLRETPEGERAGILGRECAGDPERRARLEAQLKADAASSFTEAFLPQPETEDDPAELLGTVIAGRYKLVEVIGEGGMGSVYRAEQSEPVKRNVALKLIKRGLDS